ncbi:MAG: response regulator [Elusimicrobiota bacterium]
MSHEYQRSGIRPVRIAVVDDSQDAAELFTFCLRNKGYQTARAFDGRSGLALLSTLIPDVALINYMMPFMFGTDMLMELRADPRTAGMKVIINSASPRAERLAMEAGADAFLHVPFDMRRLIDTVNHMLGR